MGEISGCRSVAVVGAGRGRHPRRGAAGRPGRRSAGSPSRSSCSTRSPAPATASPTPPRDPRHRLNVSAGRISAWPDRDDDFLRLAVRSTPRSTPTRPPSRRGCCTATTCATSSTESLAARRGRGAGSSGCTDAGRPGWCRSGRRWRVRVGPDQHRGTSTPSSWRSGSGTPGRRAGPRRAAPLRLVRRRPLGAGCAGAAGRDRRRPAARRHRPDHGRRRAAPWPGPAAPCTRSPGTACCPRRTATSSSRRLPAPDLPRRRAVARPTLDRAVAATSARDDPRDRRLAAGHRRPAAAQLRSVATTFARRTGDVPRDDGPAPGRCAGTGWPHPSPGGSPRCARAAPSRSARAGSRTAPRTPDRLAVTLPTARQLDVGGRGQLHRPARPGRGAGTAPCCSTCSPSERARPGQLGLGLATDADGPAGLRGDGTAAARAVDAGRPAPRPALRVDRHPGDPGPGPRRGRGRRSPSCPTPQIRRRPRDRYGLADERLARGGHRLRHRARGPAARAVRRRDLAAARRRRRPRASPSPTPGWPCSATSGAPRSTSSSRSTAAVAAVAVRGDERERSFVAAVEARIRRPGPEAVGAAADPHPPLRRGRARGEHRRTDHRLRRRHRGAAGGLVPRRGPGPGVRLGLVVRRDARLHPAGAGALGRGGRAERAGAGRGAVVRARRARPGPRLLRDRATTTAGLAFLDPWIDSCGRAASHRAHFAWHAALHELAMGDDVAVRRRYAAQLAPPAVSGMRALVDSASLLWRARLAGAWADELPVDARPRRRRRRRCSSGRAPPSPPCTSRSPGRRPAIAPALAALARLRRVDRRPGDGRGGRARSTRGLQLLVAGPARRRGRRAGAVLPALWRVGGSAAQREVVEDTLLYA